MDSVVDEMNRQMYCAVYGLIRKDPSEVEALLHLLSASRHLERIADHATNIAQDVIFIVEGKNIKHHIQEER